MKKFSLSALLLLAACASQGDREVEAVGLGDGVALPARHGSVVVDGCSLDPWQTATLRSPAAHKVLSEVIFLCLVPRLDGTVGPRDPSADAAIDGVVDDLQGQGYRVHVALSFTDETGARYDGSQTAAFLASPVWRAQLVATVKPRIGHAEGIELDLQQLPDSAAAGVDALVTELAFAIRPEHTLGVFVPPSTRSPSDLPGGNAITAASIASQVDRMRIMTVDYSAAPGGPTIDPGWAVDAVRFALNSSSNVDIAYPLYGTDFGPLGHRSVTYAEAIGTASIFHAVIARAPTGAPHFDFVDVTGNAHQLWFDDADSTGRALAAWTTEVLPPSVGVLYYGLGAEDPALFDRLAARLP